MSVEMVYIVWFAFFNCIVLCARVIQSSSSSCRATRADLPDLLSPPVSIVHCSWEVFLAISCIGRELLCIGSSWSSGPCSSMWKGPQEYIAYEFILTSPACLGRLTSIVFMVGGCTAAVLWGQQDLFNTARSILV